jgi:hypothetical protein
MNNIRQNRPSPDGDLNPGPPEYESEYIDIQRKVYNVRYHYIFSLHTEQY